MRGIVAAAIASVFAIRREALGYADTGAFVSITMFTIVVTVAVYGLTAPVLARVLGLAESNPQGLLFVGADPWVRELAILLQSEGYRVLAVKRFERIFGKGNCYQLSQQQESSGKKGHEHLHGRRLFDETLTHTALQKRMAEGFTPKATLLTEEFDFDALLAQHRDSVVPLFVINSDRSLRIVTPDSTEEPQPGQTVISLVKTKA